MTRGLKKKILSHFILIAIGLVLIYPVIFMFFAAFKDSNEVFTSTSILPKEFHWENFPNGWKAGASGSITFTNYFINTFCLVIPVVLFTVVSCTLVAYGFTRFNFPGKKVFFPVMLSTMMLPNTVIIIPRFMLFKSLGWLDSYLPFYVPAIFACYPFFIFMIMQFLRNIPISLDESAKMDGCSSLRTLWSIIAPLLKPAMFSAGLFQFLWTWNDFYNQLIFINRPKNFTIALGLRLAIDSSTETVMWNEVMAMSLCSIIPLVLIFFFCQKYFVEGIASSGIKG